MTTSSPPATLPPRLNRALGIVLAIVLANALAACTTAKPTPAPEPVRAPAPQVIVVETPAPPPTDEVGPLLSYHQALRRMTQGELLKELSGLVLQKRSPRVSLQMGMVLMLTRGGGDLARAQTLLDNVANSTEASSAPIKSLAQMLSSYCAESRRLAEHVDKLTAQNKDSQRRIEQLNDMVEGLKNIERTLPVRPAASSAPAVVK
ncbi:MAG: hypothetical protein ABW069_09670 [Duganella sp.]